MFVPKVLLEYNNEIHMEYIDGVTAKKFIVDAYSTYEEEKDE